MAIFSLRLCFRDPLRFNILFVSFAMMNPWGIFKFLLWVHFCIFPLTLFLSFFRLYLNKVIGFSNDWGFARWKFCLIIFRDWIFAEKFNRSLFGKNSNYLFTRWWCLRVVFKVDWRGMLQINDFCRRFGFVSGRLHVRIWLNWLFF